MNDMRKLFVAISLLVSVLSVASFAQRDKTDVLKVGETAPDFSLVSDSGKTVTLSSIKGTTVLVFYRAYW